MFSVSCRVEVDKVRGKGRPRFTRGGHTYTPQDTIDAEDRVRHEWLSTVGTRYAQATSPVSVEIKAYQELPKSASKKRAFEPWVSKPDIDNIAKLVLDALGGVAFADDAQVIAIETEKAGRVPHGWGSHIDIKVNYLRDDK